jgi:hypothetical protein
MEGAMASNPKLFVALTTAGMVLSLTLPANAIEPAAASVEASASVAGFLSRRVDRLKAKLRATLPPASQGTIENIVQFFNFSNCSRGNWTKC